MTTTSLQSVTAMSLPRVLTTMPAPDDALITGGASAQRNRWTEVQDRLLSWKRDPGSVLYDGFDRLDPRRVDSAIDLTVDFEAEGWPAPTGCAPTPDGGISFEWRSGPILREIEIVDEGRAEYVVIRGSRVVSAETIVRDPVTRRLERLLDTGAESGN
ncbi:MAG: hypothetical protein KJZ54_03355 [Phycisphaerales bacterium]|nr:hypothetical protein [Phycisphaerales bacterium]